LSSQEDLGLLFIGLRDRSRRAGPGYPGRRALVQLGFEFEPNTRAGAESDPTRARSGCGWGGPRREGLLGRRGPRAAAELGAGPRAVARRGRRRKTGLTGGPRLAVEERALEMGWRARGLLGCGAWLGRRGGEKGKTGEEGLGQTGVLG